MIHTISLEDLEGSSPPSQILKLGLVDDNLFISMEQFDETFNETQSEIIQGGEPWSDVHAKTYANRASMVVSLKILLDALGTLAFSEGNRRAL